MLRKIEQLRLLRNITPDQAKSKIDQLIKQEDLSDPSIDTASHFILRLSYCQSEELRRWFLQQECYLFQHRLQSLSQAQLAYSVQSFCQLKPISNAQKEQLSSHLLQLMTPPEFATTTFYAVPFTQALDLVASRQCFLKGGYAYVPQARAVSVLVAKFRSELSHQLALMGASSTLHAIEDPETTRVYPLLKNLNQCLVHRESDEHGDMSAGQELTASNISQFKANMPLCMRMLQTGLEQDKKLKHGGRLQYGLFLKGAGLKLDDALSFFQRHFSNVTSEQFQKQYAYSIRHMHGKEGKRADYTPYSCAKIIMGQPPSSGDHHGCPYKHYDADHLSHLLTKLNIGTPADRKAILDLKQSNQYQFACVKHFQVQHPKAESMSPELSQLVDKVGNHPNAWFRASVEYQEHIKHNGANTDIPADELMGASAIEVSP